MSKSLGFKSFFLSARQSRDGTSRCAFVSCERKTSVTALTPHWSVDCFVRHLTVLSDWLAIPLGRLIDPIACCLGKDGFPFPPAAAVNQLIQHCVSEFRSVCWCVWSAVYPSSPSFPPTKQPAHPPFHYHPPFPHTLGENTLKDFCCCCTWPSSRPQCVCESLQKVTTARVGLCFPCSSVSSATLFCLGQDRERTTEERSRRIAAELKILH